MTVRAYSYDAWLARTTRDCPIYARSIPEVTCFGMRQTEPHRCGSCPDAVVGVPEPEDKEESTVASKRKCEECGKGMVWQKGRCSTCAAKAIVERDQLRERLTELVKKGANTDDTRVPQLREMVSRLEERELELQAECDRLRDRLREVDDAAPRNGSPRRVTLSSGLILEEEGRAPYVVQVEGTAAGIVVGRTDTGGRVVLFLGQEEALDLHDGERHQAEVLREEPAS